MTELHVLGYGSLVAEDVARGARPARLPGFRRVLGVAMDNRAEIAGYKVYLAPDGSRPAVHVAFLDLEPDPQSTVNGTLREVTGAELETLDARERNYVRVEVTVEGASGPIFAYVGSSAGRERLARGRAEGTAVVARAYLDRVRAGFAALGPEQERAFLASTELDALPIRDLERIDLAWPGAAQWHDVECASYTADLALWRDLAAERGGPVLDIGCGTGRIALDLAARGHSVVGVDADPALTTVLADRAARRHLPVRTEAADVRALDAPGRFPVAIAPMQVAQLLGGEDGRRSMLAAVHRLLEPGGVLAVALADPFEAVPPGEALPPLPDVLEIDGWVLSSTPVAVRDEGDAVAIDRRREAVSPSGNLTEERTTIRLDTVAAGTLEDEGRAAGFAVLPQERVPATPDYVGSTVVLLECPR